MTATAEDQLTAVGDLILGTNTDRGQCEVLTSSDEDGRQSVASLRIEAGLAGTVSRVNAAIQTARDLSARGPLPNPVRTGTDTAPSVSLAITCGTSSVQIGLDLTGYDVRRKAIDEDLAALAGAAATKYGERARCKPQVAPPLPEQQRGTVRMLAGNGGLDLPGAPGPGPSISVGHVEAVTGLDDGTVYLVARKYAADTNPRNADQDAEPWGQTLRIVRIRADGVAEVAWDPNLAPFSVNDSPVAGDISEKLRLQGRDTLGAVSALAFNGDQAWLVPANTLSTKDSLARPIRIVQLTGGRAVDLRVFKAPSEVNSTHLRDAGGRPLDVVPTWNAARFSAVTFDGQTPVLMDAAHGQIWRIDAVRDGKILEATVLPVATQLAPGASAAGLTGGRFAASTPEGGLSFIDSRGKVVLGIAGVNAEIDGIGSGPLELGRRQLAAAGDDVLVHAMSSQVSAPVVVRVDSRTGVVATVCVSGYPGQRDPVSDVENTRFAKAYGTSANATRLFATGFPVAAMSAVGQDLLMAPYGARILYQLTPRR